MIRDILAKTHRVSLFVLISIVITIAYIAATSFGMKMVTKTSSYKYMSNSLKLYSTLSAEPGTDTIDSIRTGAFKTALPNKILAPSIHYSNALKQTSIAIKHDPSLKNQRAIHRKYAAQSLDDLMKRLNSPLTDILSKYHPTRILRSTMHPYEATVASLTLIARVKKGCRELGDVLDDIKILRMATSKIAKDYAAKASKAATAEEAKQFYQQGISELQILYESARETAALREILEIQKDLRNIPIIELDTPTVVLVGAPNVGKSSIVRAVSSGTPEVNDYPFTTRGVTVGHILGCAQDLERIQIMDTPGLLDRPATARNEMEKITFASLAHLPTAVIFVIDPTGLSGEKSTIEAQLNVRSYLKSRFPKRPWLDVMSKGDIEISDETAALCASSINNFLRVSVKTGKGIDELNHNIETMTRKLVQMLSGNVTESQ